MYTKYSPCVHCAKYVIACGIKRVVLGRVYRNEQAVQMLREAGVKVDVYAENPEWRKELLQVFSEDIASRKNEGDVKLKTEEDS